MYTDFAGAKIGECTGCTVCRERTVVQSNDFH